MIVVESSTSYLRVVEGRHALLDLPARHLAVGDDVADFGNFLAQELLDVGQIGDARA